MADAPNIPAPSLPGYSLLADFAGSDGRRVVTLRTAALAPGTPAPKAATPPPGWQYWPSPGPVWATAGNRWVVQLRQDLPPAPTPAPVPPPVAVVPVKRIVVPANARTFGLNSYGHTADQLIENVQYEGAEQNSAQDAQGNYTFRNYRSIGSYSSTWNYGQGLYLSGIKGRVTIDGAVLAFNGRPEDQPNYTPTGKRHNLYVNADVGGLSANHVLSINGACAGIQNRCPEAEITDLFSFGNSLPLFNVMGQMKVRRATIVAPTLHHDGSNWAGGSAIDALWPVGCDDVWVIGMDGMQQPVTAKPGKAYPNAAVNVGGDWFNDDEPKWEAPPAGRLLSATNCVLSGFWAGGDFGGPNKPTSAGFTLAPNNVGAGLANLILATYRRIVGPAPDLSIVDGLNLLHSLARQAAATANPSLAVVLPH